MQFSLAYVLLLSAVLGLTGAHPTRTRSSKLPKPTKPPKEPKQQKPPAQPAPAPEPEPEKVLMPEPDLFDRFVRFTTFSVASAPVTCPHPPFNSTEIGYINETSTDTQARIFRDDNAEEIIIAFPGTRTEQDQINDSNSTKVPYDSPGVTCDNCRIHGGFLNAWNSIANESHSILVQAHEDSPSYNIILAGHSLGGAIASLAYSSLNGLGLPIHAAYTMGQPRVGDWNWANYVDKISGASDQNDGNFYRITHAADPVPGMPKQIWGFRHTGTEFWQEGQYVQNATSTWRCYGQEAVDCSNAHQNTSETPDHNLYSNVSFFIADWYCKQHK